MPNIKSKHVSEEIEKISRNNFELKNQTNEDKKNNRTFINLSHSSKEISNKDNY